MPLSIKYSIVRKICTSYRRPFSETAYITYQRSIRIQNTGVHGDVVRQNSTGIKVRHGCLTLCRRICAIDPGSKTVEVVSIAYLERISGCSGVRKHV